MQCSMGMQKRLRHVLQKYEIITQCSSIAPDKGGMSTEEKYVDLLKMVLRIGYNSLVEVCEVIDDGCCSDRRNDFYLMVKELSEKIGVDLSDYS